ncbi:hypothetical protein N9937_01775 [bacterium]|nr:hypothetical protein [bacterium]
MAAEIKTRVSMDITDFEKKMLKVMKGAEGIGKGFRTAMKITGVGIGVATAAIAGFAIVTKRGIAEAFQFGEALRKQSNQTGKLAGDILAIQRLTAKGITASPHAIANERELMGDMAEFADKHAKDLARGADALSRIGEIRSEFFMGAASVIGPELEEFVDSIDDGSFVKAGQDFGEALSSSAKVLSEIPAAFSQAVDDSPVLKWLKDNSLILNMLAEGRERAAGFSKATRDRHEMEDQADRIRGRIAAKTGAFGLSAAAGVAAAGITSPLSAALPSIMQATSQLTNEGPNIPGFEAAVEQMRKAAKELERAGNKINNTFE